MTKSMIPFQLARLIGVAASLLCGGAMAQPVIKTAMPVVPAPIVGVTVKPYSYDAIASVRSNEPAGIFNSGLIFLADQLDHNDVADVRARVTVVSSFSNLNNLSETSPFGRLVSEHLMHELQVRGWTVTDLRLTRDFIINEAGEFSLSRDIKKLRETLPVGNVLTGTYTSTPNGVLLSARVIDVATGQVMATAQTRFLRDKFIASLIDTAKPLPVVSIAR
jgi:TolB-like protein